MTAVDLKKFRVPKTAITERGLKKLIRRAMKKQECSMSEWAIENGLTPQSVSAFMRDTQTAGLQIPEVFGFRPQTVYLPLDEELITTPKASRVVKKKVKNRGKRD